MSSSRRKHEKNYTSCHHCHLTSPIPLSELIRTHPLRSVVAKECDGEDVIRKCPHKRKESPIQEECDVQSLLDDVASNEYRLRKLRCVSSSSEKSYSENSLSRDSIDADKFIKPVHSFLHHEASTSAYKEPLIPCTYNTNTINSKQSRKSSRALISSGTILNPRGLEIPDTHSSHSKHYSSIQNFSKPRSDYTFRNIETQTSRNNSTLNGFLYNNSKPSGSDVTLLSILNRKHSKKKRCDKFCCSLPSGLLFAGYGLLIVIGIVIAVALSQRERRISLKSASVPQRPVAFSGAVPSPVEERKIAIRKPPIRRRINTALKKTVRPVQRVTAAQNIRPVSFPQPTPAPQPRHQPQPNPSVVGVPLQIFREDDDLDYFDNVGFNDQDFLLPKQNVQQQQSQFVPQQSVPKAPTHQAFRPVEIEPQFRPQSPVPSPAQEIRTIARVVPRQHQQQQHQQQHHQLQQQQQQHQQQQTTAPRRTIPATFQQEFNGDRQGTTQRGQRQPAVKIVKSWSNRNADGTFSWGYINTDGSFKNETKGADCVVRGVYGYVDEKTGETLSFPYVSGNPCDPNEPDYYYDYDEGTINQAGKVVKKPKKATQLVAKRRPS